MTKLIVAFRCFAKAPKGFRDLGLLSILHFKKQFTVKVNLFLSAPEGTKLEQVYTISPLIVNIVSRWMWVVSFKLRPFCLRK
jgi:hypothetical protein